MLETLPPFRLILHGTILISATAVQHPGLREGYVIAVEELLKLWQIVAVHPVSHTGLGEILQLVQFCLGFGNHAMLLSATPPATSVTPAFLTTALEDRDEKGSRKAGCRKYDLYDYREGGCVTSHRAVEGVAFHGFAACVPDES